MPSPDDGMLTGEDGGGGLAVARGRTTAAAGGRGVRRAPRGRGGEERGIRPIRVHGAASTGHGGVVGPTLNAKEELRAAGRGR